MKLDPYENPYDKFERDLARDDLASRFSRQHTDFPYREYDEDQQIYPGMLPKDMPQKEF